MSKDHVRSSVASRDGYRCILCRQHSYGLHLHRIRYASQGGKYEVDNCVLACAEHHMTIHSNKKLWQPILLEYIEREKVEETFDVRAWLASVVKQHLTT